MGNGTFCIDIDSDDKELSQYQTKCAFKSHFQINK